MKWKERTSTVLLFFLKFRLWKPQLLRDQASSLDLFLFGIGKRSQDAIRWAKLPLSGSSSGGLGGGLSNCPFWTVAEGQTSCDTHLRASAETCHQILYPSPLCLCTYVDFSLVSTLLKAPWITSSVRLFLRLAGAASVQPSTFSCCA